MSDQFTPAQQPASVQAAAPDALNHILGLADDLAFVCSHLADVVPAAAGLARVGSAIRARTAELRDFLAKVEGPQQDHS